MVIDALLPNPERWKVKKEGKSHRPLSTGRIWKATGRECWKGDLPTHEECKAKLNIRIP